MLVATSISVWPANKKNVGPFRPIYLYIRIYHGGIEHWENGCFFVSLWMFVGFMLNGRPWSREVGEISRDFRMGPNSTNPQGKCWIHWGPNLFCFWCWSSRTIHLTPLEGYVFKKTWVKFVRCSYLLKKGEGTGADLCETNIWVNAIKTFTNLKIRLEVEVDHPPFFRCWRSPLLPPVRHLEMASLPSSASQVGSSM